MPDSSIILSKRKDSIPKNKTLRLFFGVVFIVAVLGVFSYYFVLENYGLAFVTNKNSEKIAEEIPPEVKKNVPSSTPQVPENSVPNNVFVGLSDILNTRFSDVATQTVNPLTGNIVGSDKKQNLKVRPWAVMIDNRPLSRPQIGIGSADIVYEAVKELGITSLLAIYYEQRPPEVGPVDELRYYFASVAAEYVPFLIHNGGPEKLESEPTLSTSSDVDIYSFIGSNGIYSIDQTRGATEVFTSVVNDSDKAYFLDTGDFYAYLGKIFGSYLWVDSDKFTKWHYKEVDFAKERIDAITFNFWDLVDYEVTWKYNPGENNYIRLQGGVVFQDKISRQQVTSRNVILQFVEEESTGDLDSNLKYNLVGEGDLIIYLDGTKVTGKWKKADINSRTEFISELGNPLKLNKGNVWVEILPNESRLKIKEQSGI